MDKRIIKFDDTDIEQNKFHQYKGPISIKDIDINKIVGSNKFPFGKQDFKYFIGYKDSYTKQTFMPIQYTNDYI